MDIQEEIAQALRASGELGSRKPDVGVIAEALMPLVRRAQAEALREAVSDFEGSVGVDEFDEMSARPGRHGPVKWFAIEEAWEHQGPFMDWFRNRADRIEKEGAGA